MIEDTAPNYKEVHTCYTCKHHTQEWGECTIYCTKYLEDPSKRYGYFNRNRVDPNGICDSWELEQ